MGRGHRAGEEGSRSGTATPLLEWASAAIGLVITLAMLGFIGWQAWTGTDDAPPAVAVSAGPITRSTSGYVVLFTAENLSGSTAAAVQVHGALKDGERTVATSQVTLDYVPGNSTRHGGLFFQDDPAAYRLKLRALGYAEP